MFFGRAVIPAIRDLIQNTINPAVEGLKEWVKQNGELIKVNVAEWLGKIVQVGQGVKEFFTAVLPTVGPFLTTVAAGWGALPPIIQTTGLLTALLLGPKGALIIGGITLLSGVVQKMVEITKEGLNEVSKAERERASKLFKLLESEKRLVLEINALSQRPGAETRVAALGKALASVRTQMFDLNKAIKESAEVTHFAADKLGDFGDEAVKAARKLRAIPAAAGEAAEKTKEIFGTTGMEILAARSRQAREFLGFMDQETEATDLSAQERFDIRVRENERIARLYAQRGKEYQRHFARPVKKSARELLADQRKQLNGASASFGTLWSAVQLGAPKPIRTCRTSACWPLTRRSRLSER